VKILPKNSCGTTSVTFYTPGNFIFAAVNWINKNGSNLLFVVLQTSTPIKAFVSGLFAFSSSVQDAKDREVLQTYDWQLADMTVCP
jgi:hypothetical protein